MKTIINHPGPETDVVPERDQAEIVAEQGQLHHFISNYKRLKDKEGGNNPSGGGGIYTGFGKILLFKRDCSKKDIAEFLAARLLNLLIGDSAAPIILARQGDPKTKNPAIRSEETDKDVYIGSVFTEGYEDFYKVVYREEGYSIPADRPRFIGSFNQGPVQQVLLQEKYTDFERITVSRLLLGDFDLHPANSGVVWPANEGGQKRLMAIDFAAAFRNLPEEVHLHSHLRHLPGRGPTNHYREFPRALRVSWPMAQEMERVAQYPKEMIEERIDTALDEINIYYSNAALRAFATRLGMERIAQIEDSQLLEAIKTYLKKLIVKRQQSLQEHAIEIQLSLCCKYDSVKKEWYALSDIDQLFAQYPNYFKERYKNPDKNFHFRCESHKGSESKLTDLVNKLYYAYIHKENSKDEVINEQLDEGNKEKEIDKEIFKDITTVRTHIKDFSKEFNEVKNKFEKIFLMDLEVLFDLARLFGTSSKNRIIMLGNHINNTNDPSIDMFPACDNKVLQVSPDIGLKNPKQLKEQSHERNRNKDNKVKINRLKIEIDIFKNDLNKFIKLFDNIAKVFHADVIYNPIDAVRDIRYLLENLQLLLRGASRLVRDFSTVVNDGEIDNQVSAQIDTISKWNLSLHKLAYDIPKFYDSISQLVISGSVENLTSSNDRKLANGSVGTSKIDIEEILNTISISNYKHIKNIVDKIIDDNSSKKYIEAIYQGVKQYKEKIPWYVCGSQLKINILLKYLNQKVLTYPDKKDYTREIPQLIAKPNFVNPQQPEIIAVEASVLALLPTEEKYKLFDILVDAYNRNIEIFFINGEEKINKMGTEKGKRITFPDHDLAVIADIYNMPTLFIIENDKYDNFCLQRFPVTKKNVNKVCFVTSSVERCEKAQYAGYQAILAKKINTNKGDYIFLDNLERRIKINDFFYSFKSASASLLNVPRQVFKVVNQARISALSKLFSYWKTCWQRRNDKRTLSIPPSSSFPLAGLKLNHANFLFPAAPANPHYAEEPTIEVASIPYIKTASYSWLSYLAKGFAEMTSATRIVLTI